MDPQRRLERLAARFTGAFPEGPLPWRTVGREAEHPLVHADGTAAALDDLWSRLEAPGDLRAKREGALTVALEGPDFSYTSEVGRGTVEIVTRPCDDLHELGAVVEGARERLVQDAAAEGIAVLGYGTQPLTPPTGSWMTPKHRYGVLLASMGADWLWFTVTAADQVHVAVTRDEFLATANLCNLLAPVTIALCGHSPIHSGSDSGVCSSREHAMGAMHPAARHGMTPGPFRDTRALVAHAARQPFLMEKVDGVNRVHRATFAAWLAGALDADDEAVWAAFLHHEHYIWNSARPRTAHGTVEVRAACQQPPAEHGAAAALGAAMVLAASPLASWLAEALDDPWATLGAWHAEVIRDGLGAPEPVPGLIAGVLDRCEAALAARGRGEEVWLAPLRRRLARRENPAQRARRVWQAEGWAGLHALTAFGGR